LLGIHGKLKKKRDHQQGLLRIISGGQTGVDRAALDVAFALGLPHGGFCPRGRRAEDGVIPHQYQLEELDSEDYAVRTERNVIEADATLILYQRRMTGGTLLTFNLAKKHHKPHRTIRLDRHYDPQRILDWINETPIGTLNVAGPRATTDPEIYERAATFLWETLKQARGVRLEAGGNAE
jgi:hypothetical protein